MSKTLHSNIGSKRLIIYIWMLFHIDSMIWVLQSILATLSEWAIYGQSYKILLEERNICFFYWCLEICSTHAWSQLYGARLTYSPSANCELVRYQKPLQDYKAAVTPYNRHKQTFLYPSTVCRVWPAPAWGALEVGVGSYVLHIEWG